MDACTRDIERASLGGQTKTGTRRATYSSAGIAISVQESSALKRLAMKAGVVRTFVRREQPRQRPVVDYKFDGALSGRARQRFRLGECVLNRIDVRTVGRDINEPRSPRAPALVPTEIVRDDDGNATDTSLQSAPAQSEDVRGV